MKEDESLIGDLVIIGGAEIYVNDVRIHNIKELEEAIEKLDEGLGCVTA